MVANAVSFGEERKMEKGDCFLFVFASDNTLLRRKMEACIEINKLKT